MKDDFNSVKEDRIAKTTKSAQCFVVMDERIESDIIPAVKANLIINNTNQSWF